MPGIQPLLAVSQSITGPSSVASASAPPISSPPTVQPDPTHEQRGQAKQTYSDPPQQQWERNHDANTRHWTQVAMKAMTRAEAYIYPYGGKRVRTSTLEDLRAKAEKVIDNLLNAQPHCREELQTKVTTCIVTVARIIAELEDQSIDLSQESQPGSLLGSPNASSSPRKETTGPPQSTNALLHTKRMVESLLRLIADDNLTDVAPGAAIDIEMLKYLHDVRVREINRIIKDCRDATGKYAAQYGSDFTLISQAQDQCKRAYEWTQEVVHHFRGGQLHLEGNLPAKEVTFKVFDPNGKVSIYEFLSSYEKWAHGYL